jgi:hypothetical protein
MLTILFVSLLSQKIKHGPTPPGDDKSHSEKPPPLSLKGERQTKE